MKNKNKWIFKCEKCDEVFRSKYAAPALRMRQLHFLKVHMSQEEFEDLTLWLPEEYIETACGE